MSHTTVPELIVPHGPEHPALHSNDVAQTQSKPPPPATAAAAPSPQSKFESHSTSDATTAVDRRSPSKSDLPPLPSSSPFDNRAMLSSDFASDSNGPQPDSSLLERDVTKKLMDLESSFLPDNSMVPGVPEASGKDDTFLFGGSPGRTADLGMPKVDEEEEVSSMLHAPTPASAYKTPHPIVEDYETDAGADGDESKDSTGLMPSSPAAAAKQRGLLRAESRDGGIADIADDLNPHIMSSRPSLQPRSAYGSIDEGAFSPSPALSPDLGSDHSTIPALQSPPYNSSSRQFKRPSFLQNRTASQRSSVTSLTGRSDASGGTDVTLGADYALQSGGAAPTSAPQNISLSRLPSLGSIASSFSSSHSDTAPTLGRTRSSTIVSGVGNEGHLASLEEEDRRGYDSQPETPRAASVAGGAPTDTIISQHVQNIRVPETVAREYREKHRTRSPERRHAIGLSYSSRTKHNLTLKEQNSKIDKLSKENFDLKLKIHFLDQALQNRSDEGVKEMISKNVQLQTDLATEKKENQTLRRKVRELERKLKAQEERKEQPQEEEDAKSDDDEKAEMEEEITYLRECVQQMQSEVERLREENLSKEVDKRRLAEYVKSMGEERRTSEPAASIEEVVEMWKDLLQAETARREQADEDAAKLRDEIRRMKTEPVPSTTHNHTRNVYNVSRRHQTSYSLRPESESPQHHDAETEADSRASTLVETLKHENAELRRDLSAQTSMLTSRNRERERLQQEIEDLKLHQRRGGDGGRSVAGDSIFERSVSRAHVRSSSRASGATRATHTSDHEREDLERKLGQLRDELAEVKMLNQDLERALNEHLDTLEALEAENRNMKDETTLAAEDLQQLQRERDDLLSGLQQKEEDFETLRSDAVETIDKMEEELEQKDQDFSALQSEMKSVSETVVRLEDELNAGKRKEQALESQLEESEQEIASLESKLADMSSKNERLDVQLESSQNEIAFLREEQEGDKIKIGELEAAIAAAQSSIEDMQAQAEEERRQREALDTKEKAEVQRMLDDLNAQNIQSKEEGRKLRKKLNDKEREAETWKERLETLESNLREALGDLNGTRSSLLKDVTKLQRDLEHTLSALDIARQDLAEKDRLLRDRDALLENSALESRKLADLLEKERLARRNDRNTFDAMQRSQQSLTRTIQQSDTRVHDLESARQSERKRYLGLEHSLREQLAERNGLLLALWTRLSTLCGADFMQKNNLIGGDALPSVESVARNLPAFARNVNLAIKTVEVLVGGFRARIRDVERGLWKDFQNLERALDVRTKRIDHLEKMVLAQRQAVEEQRSATAPSLPPTVGTPTHNTHATAAGPAGGSRSASRASSRNSGVMLRDDEMKKLRSENRALKAEMLALRAGSGSPRGSGGASVPERGSSVRVRGDHSHSSHHHLHLQRHFSSSVVETGGGSPIAIDPTLTVPRRDAHGDGSPNVVRRVSHLPVPASAGGRPSSASAVAAAAAAVHSSNSHAHAQTLGYNQHHHGSGSGSSASGGGGGSSSLEPSEQRWIHRLKELERRLKAEREARLLDRSGARKRIEEAMAENLQLAAQLEREKKLRKEVPVAGVGLNERAVVLDEDEDGDTGGEGEDGFNVVEGVEGPEVMEGAEGEGHGPVGGGDAGREGEKVRREEVVVERGG